jgi:PEP-CTERM motif
MKNQFGTTTGGTTGTPGRKQCSSQKNPRSPLLYRLVGSVLPLALLCAMIPEASGQTYNISNGNSVVSVNATPSANAGMFNYSVNAVNQAVDQWFWYRAGSMSSQSSIDTIGALTATQSDARDLSLTYSGSQYSATVVYKLTGGSAGSGQSGLNEGITFLNTSSANLTLSFFDYANFQLGGTPSGQTLQFKSSSIPPPLHYGSFTQTAGPLSLTTQITGGIGGGSPGAVNPSHIEAANYNQTLTELNSGTPITLDDNPGPVSGNVTGTFEWDVTLAPGTSLTLSSLINITSVPEPSSLMLLALGLGIGAALSRRAKRNLTNTNSNH